MTTTTATAGNTVEASSAKGLNIALWVVQGLLALAFGVVGSMKLFTPLAELTKTIPWVTPELGGLIRFIGASELAGALGLLLPGLTRIKPGLTVLAAAGLVLVMLLASIFHISRGELIALPTNFMLGGLAAFVALGRSKAPILPR